MKFMAPYTYLCLLSAWGIAQNLEGLGAFKYFNDSVERIGDRQFMLTNLDPGVGVSIISVIVTLVLLFVLYLNVRACFAIRSSLGVKSMLIWGLPGLLSLFGYSVDPQWFAPDVFRFAVGFPGGVGSAAANLAIVLVLGWSVAILFGSRWERNKLKNLYDHFWYPLGLAAVLYFVIDSGLPFYKADVDEASANKIEILNLYKASAKSIERACEDSKYISTNAADLCRFQDGLSENISTQIDERREIRDKMDLPIWIKTLSSDANNKILRDIDLANAWACAGENLSQLCIAIPFEDVVNMQNPGEKYIFLPTAYAKRLAADDASIKKVNDRINEIEMGHNIRYFAFLAVGLLAGGKVANATRALLSTDISKQKSWTVVIFKFIYLLARATFVGLWSGLRLLFDSFRALLRSARNDR